MIENKSHSDYEIALELQDQEDQMFAISLNHEEQNQIIQGNSRERRRETRRRLFAEPSAGTHDYLNQSSAQHYFNSIFTVLIGAPLVNRNNEEEYEFFSNFLEPVQKGISFQRMTQLPLINYNINNSTKECVICLVLFKKNEKVISLPCFHLFHQICINQWLKINHLCPVCKMDVNTEQYK